MSDIRPFKGVRPRPDLVEKVAAPPYDVLNSKEARELARDNPLSFLHVTKAEIDMPKDADVHSEALYKLSANSYRKMRNDGTFVQDDTPCFYVYQLIMGDHIQKGLAVGASVDEYETDKIKKHELTRREKEDDRARHVEILKANAGPVLFTYKARDEIRIIIESISSTSEPVYDFKAPDGIAHTLWVVSDPDAVKKLQDAFLSVDALYVADGHHRTASALRVRNIMRDKNPNHTGAEDYNHFLAVLFPDDELKIMGYHRVIKDLNGLSVNELIEKAKDKFNINKSDDSEPAIAHSFKMYVGGQWYELKAKDGTFSANDPVEGMDGSVLQKNLIEPILGIADLRTDNRIDFVGGIRGMGELERRCQEDMEIAFALAPVTVARLMAVADAGVIMPPKSTWFEPKLCSGVVVREF